MQEYQWITIIVEERLGHWVAWFEELPDDTRGGESFWTAVATLLESAGWDNFKLEQALGDYPQTGSGRAHFYVPFHGEFAFPAMVQ